ncbi:MAG: hypothetical protein AABY28_05930 [Candidatus Omnitrophota bacterium]
MTINYLKSFDRSFKRMDRAIQGKAISAIDALMEFLRNHQKPAGLGLKKIHKNYWEIRLDIRNRIIFELVGDSINIAFVGDHNSVKAFFK